MLAKNKGSHVAQSHTCHLACTRPTLPPPNLIRMQILIWGIWDRTFKDVLPLSSQVMLGFVPLSSVRVTESRWAGELTGNELIGR